MCRNGRPRPDGQPQLTRLRLDASREADDNSLRPSYSDSAKRQTNKKLAKTVVRTSGMERLHSVLNDTHRTTGQCAEGN